MNRMMKHVRRMEELRLKNNTDCVDFLASPPVACKKGVDCEYRHSEFARVTTEECWKWSSGNCLNEYCPYRHPPLDGPTEESTVTNQPVDETIYAGLAQLREEPCLVTANRKATFYSLIHDKSYRFPQFEKKGIICSDKPMIVLKDHSQKKCFILKIAITEKDENELQVQIPTLEDFYAYDYAIISSPHLDRNCRIIFFSSHSTEICTCRLGDTKYMELDWQTGDVEYYKATVFNGKLHLVGFPLITCMVPHCDLYTCDFLDPELRFTEVIDGGLIFESLPGSPTFCGYLVDCCSDLLMVWLNIFENEIMHLKVLRADMDKKEWVAIETLGDRVLFIGTPHNKHSRGFSSPASPYGLKGDVIYLVIGRMIHTYDLEDNSMNVSLISSHIKEDPTLLWSWLSCEADVRGKVIKRKRKAGVTIETVSKRSKKEDSKSIAKENNSPFDNVPEELLEKMLSLLYGGDRAVFRLVCKSWALLSSDLVWHLGDIRNLLSSSPYLLFSDKILHPFSGEYYHFKYPKTLGTIIRDTREGWLLVTQGCEGIFLLNYISKVKVLVPNIIDSEIASIAFCYSVYFSPPPNWSIVIVVKRSGMIYQELAIAHIKVGEEKWKFSYLGDDFFDFSSTNPVYYKGLLYFLGKYKGVLIYDPKGHIHSINDSFIGDPLDLRERTETYFLEIDGRLMSVFICNDRARLYQWDMKRENTWEVVETLGTKMIFVSRACSFSLEATVRGTANKIYFPRLVGNDILFYSLSTKRLGTFSLGCHREIQNLKRPVGATWILVKKNNLV